MERELNQLVTAWQQRFDKINELLDQHISRETQIDHETTLSLSAEALCLRDRIGEINKLLAIESLSRQHGE